MSRSNQQNGTVLNKDENKDFIKWWKPDLSMQALMVCSEKERELKIERRVSVSWPNCLLDMELRHEGSATGGKKIRIQYGEESPSELTKLLAGYGAPTWGLCNRRKEGFRHTRGSNTVHTISHRTYPGDSGGGWGVAWSRLPCPPPGTPEAPILSTLSAQRQG